MSTKLQRKKKQRTGWYELEYEELVKHIHSIDLTKVIEEDDNTTLVDEIACGASGCEIK